MRGRVRAAGLSVASLCLLATVLLGGATALGQTAADECPVTGTHVIDLTGTSLLDFEDLSSGLIDVAIPAGAYTVTLVASDHGVDRAAQQQMFEQFFVRLFDADGNVVYQSPPTDDIPDTETAVTDTVDDLALVPVDVASLEALHVAFEIGNQETANSVEPVCAVFDETPSANLVGVVWNDLDRDGLRDDGEPGVAGVGVELLGGGEASTTTDAEGGYRFDGLPPATYRVRVVPPAGWALSPQSAGGNIFASGVSPAGATIGETGPLVVGAGSDSIANAGIYQADDLVPPAIGVEPGSGERGDAVTVAGEGYDAGDMVEVFLGGVPVGQPVQVGTAGDFEVTGTVPAGVAAGPVDVTVVRGREPEAAPVPFIVLAPRVPVIGVSPSTGATGDEVTVTGEGYDAGDTVDVFFGGVRFAARVGVDAAGEFTARGSVPDDLEEGPTEVVATRARDPEAPAVGFTVAADVEAGGCFEILGLCWWWWLLVIAAVLLLVLLWWRFRRDPGP